MTSERMAPKDPEPTVPVETHTVSLTLDRADHARVTQIAASQHRTFSGQMRQIVREYIAQADTSEAALAA